MIWLFYWLFCSAVFLLFSIYLDNEFALVLSVLFDFEISLVDFRTLISLFFYTTLVCQCNICFFFIDYFSIISFIYFINFLFRKLVTCKCTFCSSTPSWGKLFKLILIALSLFRTWWWSYQRWFKTHASPIDRIMFGGNESEITQGSCLPVSWRDWPGIRYVLK